MTRDLPPVEPTFLLSVLESVADPVFIRDELRGVLESGRMRVHEYTLSATDVEGNPQDGPNGVQGLQGRIARVGRLSPGGKPCVVVNISERKRLEAELDRLAHRDELTGLHNRRSVPQVADARMAEASSAGRDPGLHLAMSSSTTSRRSTTATAT